jgi:hypothetical protein
MEEMTSQKLLKSNRNLYSRKLLYEVYGKFKK